MFDLLFVGNSAPKFISFGAKKTLAYLIQFLHFTGRNEITKGVGGCRYSLPSINKVSLISLCKSFQEG